MYKKLLPLIIITLVLFGLASQASAATVPLSGYAWSSNIGWIKFSGANYGVNYDSGTGVFSGYAWSSNIGWINFAPVGPYPAAPNSGVVLAGNNLTGWARAVGASGTSGWDGWIKMGGTGYAVTINNDHLDPSSYAWGSDVVGWIHMCSASYPAGYCVSVGGTLTASCSVSPAGSVTVPPPVDATWHSDTPSGGNGSYSYRWQVAGPSGYTSDSNWQASPDHLTSGLSSIGPYTGSLSVRDSSGLTTTNACSASLQVNSGPSLSVSCSATQSANSTDVTWDVSGVSGGTPSYSYSWLVDSSLSSSLNPFLTPNLLPGLHTGIVTVTDSASRTGTCNASINVVPGGTTYPTLSIFNGLNLMEINSQPLGSPAISSFAAFSLTNAPAATPVVIKSIKSFTTGQNLVVLGSNLSPLGNFEVTCRFGAPTNAFAPCIGQTIQMNNSSPASYLQIQISRPVQVINDNNPYRVIVGVDDPACPGPSSGPCYNAENRSATFDYSVSTVNPR